MDSSEPLHVMILAAGMGSRLRPFTDQVPKPAIPFLGVPLAFYGLELLDRIKIDNLVVNTHHLPQQVEQVFLNAPPSWKNLIFSPEPKGLLGSGGGIHQALPHLLGHGDFLVMNADEVLLPESHGLIDEMLSFHRFHRGIATLLCLEHPEVGHKFGGVWVKDSPVVTDFSKTAIPGCKGLHYTGILILSDRIKHFFSHPLREENILYETLKSAMNQGEQVFAYECQAQWFETGNPTDFLSATRTCVDALAGSGASAGAGGSESGWVRSLRQVISRCSTEQMLIEKTDPELASRLSRVLQSLRGS